MPESSTLDIALVQREMKKAILLRRHVSARLASTQVNLGPEIEPGTYSLLLTVYRGRSSTVPGVIRVKRGILALMASKHQVTSPVVSINSTSRRSSRTRFSKTSLFTPHTIGWTVPKALDKVPHALVNIALVSNEKGSDDSALAKVVRVLAANVDARAGFQICVSAKDIPRGRIFQLRIEMSGIPTSSRYGYQLSPQSRRG
ncbi:hypothetical protein BGZ65_005133 [Modicella reniformis]|uniref:Uncharacterized protein n=1 Tax=Modicella reniformis TaxID=1440133 RepID=A0A9P6MGQ1_9FUNG|nr:hypothetical protein BGZ65_005133 [Modicella reniformis]